MMPALVNYLEMVVLSDGTSTVLMSEMRGLESKHFCSSLKEHLHRRLIDPASNLKIEQNMRNPLLEITIINRPSELLIDFNPMGTYRFSALCWNFIQG